MRIVAFSRSDELVCHQAAELLVEAFPHHNGWPTLDAAIGEVTEAVVSERRCRAALDAEGNVLGWIGATPGYRGRVWELHPLVVRASARGQGVGRELVRDLERTLTAEGALTLWLGTDDDHGETTLAHLDLYPDPLARLAYLHAPSQHPVGFYLRVGFVVTGVVPDANGRGLPGILMAKRLG